MATQRQMQLLRLHLSPRMSEEKKVSIVHEYMASGDRIKALTFIRAAYPRSDGNIATLEDALEILRQMMNPTATLTAFADDATYDANSGAEQREEWSDYGARQTSHLPYVPANYGVWDWMKRDGWHVLNPKGILFRHPLLSADYS